MSGKIVITSPDDLRREKQRAIEYFRKHGRYESMADRELFAGPILGGVTIGPDGVTVDRGPAPPLVEYRWGDSPPKNDPGD